MKSHNMQTTLLFVKEYLKSPSHFERFGNRDFLRKLFNLDVLFFDVFFSCVTIFPFGLVVLSVVIYNPTTESIEF